MTYVPADFPVIETERLILRGPRVQDFEPLAAFYATGHSRFVGGPLTPELAWRALAIETGHWTLRGFGRWAITRKDTGEWLGMTGLWHPEGFPEPELGWDLARHATGQGYATEAATAARAHAYDTLGWSTLISLVADGNDASGRVAERLGARPDGRFTHERFGPMNVWRHPAPKDLT